MAMRVRVGERESRGANIKDAETERLAAEVAQMAGESKTRAIRVGLQEREQRLAFGVKRRSRKEQMLRLRQRDVWPQVPSEERGRRLAREEEEAILGYGLEGA